MKAITKWIDQLPNPDGEKLRVASVDFKFDGTELAVCAGQAVLLYQCNGDGKLLKQLKGHKQKVYTVSYSKDGRRLASGGADNCTIIWSEEGRGLLKFSHTESVQVVAYNPVHDLLASCSISDFGFWSSKEKSITKHKIESKIISAAWTKDGQIFAIGCYSGGITLRNLLGYETVLISRSAPIWTLAWNWCSSSDGAQDILAVGCWDKTLSFFNISGEQIHDDRCLDYFPCTLSYYGPKSNYILVGGSGKRVDLFSREGLFLHTLSNQSGWVWSIVGQKSTDKFASVSNDGNLSYSQVCIEDIIVKHNDRYAYRDRGTGVVIQHLTTQQKERIECNHCVKKISLYTNRLAVQLQTNIHIYELRQPQGPYGVRYQIKHIIHADLPCNHMAIVSHGLILSSNNEVWLYNFDGEKVREWILQSNINCLKILCGPPGQEHLIAGLEGSQVVSICVDNLFSIPLLSHTNPVVSLDVSSDHQHVGIVDNRGHLLIHNVMLNRIAHQTEGPVKNIFFHNEINNLFCYGGNGTTTIQDLSGSVHIQDTVGQPVHFSGSHIFSIHDATLICTDIYISTMVEKQLQKNNYDAAYKLATFGVSDTIWKILAHQALRGNNLFVANKSFHHLRDRKFIEFVKKEMNKPSYGSKNISQNVKHQELMSAQIAILEGRLQDAGKIYAKSGCSDEAINIFIKMKRFNEAKALVNGTSSSDMMRVNWKEAIWQEEIKNWKDAAEIFMTCKDMSRAVKVVGDTKGEGWVKFMTEILYRIHKTDIKALESCCGYLIDQGVDDHIKEIFRKMGDYSKLLRLLVKNRNWVEVGNLCYSHGHEVEKDLLLPYAEWLALEARYDDARVMYWKAGQPDQSKKLLMDLIKYAIAEERYRDVSKLYFELSAKFYKGKATEIEVTNRLGEYQKCCDYMKLYELFYAYAHIHEYHSEPFTALEPDIIIQACSFLLNTFDTISLQNGVSIVKIAFVFIKLARKMGAFQCARLAYTRLQTLYIAPSLEEELHIDMMTIEVEPHQDDLSRLPVCFRCGSSQPYMNRVAEDTDGPYIADFCLTCKHPHVRCFITFNILPLIEFVPIKSIAEEQAITLICQYPNTEQSDLLENAIDIALSASQQIYVPVEADPDTLIALHRDDVFVLEYVNNSFIERRFYKNLIADIGIAVCQSCHHFFHEQDFEYAFLKEGGCPVCNMFEIGNVR